MAIRYEYVTNAKLLWLRLYRVSLKKFEIVTWKQYIAGK